MPKKLILIKKKKGMSRDDFIHRGEKHCGHLRCLTNWSKGRSLHRIEPILEWPIDTPG